MSESLPKNTSGQMLLLMAAKTSINPKEPAMASNINNIGNLPYEAPTHSTLPLNKEPTNPKARRIIPDAPIISLFLFPLLFRPSLSFCCSLFDLNPY